MKDLNPVDPALVPFNVGEIVAFTEDHAAHPAQYGRIESLGVDKQGSLKLDLLVYDPAVGITEDATVIYRAGMEEIQ